MCLCDVSTDFQLLRCIVKILEVVYPKIKKGPISNKLMPRKRSSSATVSTEHEQDYSPSRGQHNSNNSEVSVADKIESRERRELVEERDVTCQELSSVVNCDNHSNSSTSDAKAAEFNNKMTRILYEVIQNLLIDILALLEKVFIFMSTSLGLPLILLAYLNCRNVRQTMKLKFVSLKKLG